ncbi:unnamed protein product [Phytomonas sp. Hart1]|nr:unnamed protein product [Phytomonas sp. Hart1]|eukprot:CCW70209.1 unnamed protein product [Phytomonas sp. isolate Hart1]
MSDSQTGSPHAMSKVKHVILVLSGKGGVGKSTVSCQLAFSLSHMHHMKVGLLDADICGPSVPKICGLEGRDVFRDAQGWQPITIKASDTTATDSVGGGELKVMSIAYLLPSDKDAVVWRGPKKDAMIKQFISDVNWGPLDYLIVDTPPGTSDEHLTLCEVLKPFNPSGAVIVTTPQDVATDDVKKELSFCAKLGVRCLGIIENMSGFVCPHCDHCTNIFSTGGGKKLADLYEVMFLGAIPIDPSLSLAEDEGKAFVHELSSTENASTSTQKTISMLITVINNIIGQVYRAEQSSKVNSC